MSGPRKRVYVCTHGPLGIVPGVQVGWEDVSLRLFIRRSPIHLAPCLVSRTQLESDIEITSDPDLEELLACVDQCGYHVVYRQLPPVLADVYTRRSWIDKAEAERMFDMYLSTIGVRRAVYKWKRTSITSWPVTSGLAAVAA